MIFFKPEVAATNEFTLFFQCGGSPRQIKTALVAVGPNANNGEGHEGKALFCIAAAFAFDVAALYVFCAVKGGDAVVKCLNDGFAHARGGIAFGHRDKVIAADVAHKVALGGALFNYGRKPLKGSIAIFKAVFVIVGFEIVYVEIEHKMR